MVNSTAIPLFKVAMSPDAPRLVGETLMSGYIGQGERVEEFEGMLERYFETPILTVNSCTSALQLALYLAGVRAGDEVVTSPLTCTATNGAIVTCGAIPVWADVTHKGVIDPESVSKLISTRTKAIMAVDWGGERPDYGTLKSFGYPVIQDAAHSFRASDHRADYTAWSGQAIKFLTTGDGGWLACPEDQYQRAKLLRWYGLDRESKADFRCAQNIQEVGWKYHMNDIAASIGIANFDLARRNAVAHWKNGERICGGTALRWVGFIRVRERAQFMDYCSTIGIATSLVHKRNDHHDAFRRASKNPDDPRPGLDAYDREYVAVPVGWWLTDKEVDMIQDVVWSWKEKYPVEV